MSIVVRGGGVAATTCSFVLRSAGFALTLEPSARLHVPAVMLPPSSQKLFEDVLGASGVFRSAAHISKRIVKWGTEGQPMAVPHSAVVVSEQFLLDQLEAKSCPANPTLAHGSDWKILSSHPFPEDSIQYEFGSRKAAVVSVHLKDGCDQSACWIESLADGWLFLIPDATGRAWLIAVGDSPASHLRSSGIIADQIQQIQENGSAFSSHPGIAWPLCGRNWLACGSAALRFDPLCGDGVGHAIREAILAAAIVRAASRGADIDRLLTHYRMRLVAAFKRHLIHCAGFYRSGGESSWWRSELESIERGVKWCDKELGDAATFHYRLNGFELEAIRRNS